MQTKSPQELDRKKCFFRPQKWPKKWEKLLYLQNYAFLTRSWIYKKWSRIHQLSNDTKIVGYGFSWPEICPLEVWPKAQKADLPYRGTKKSDSKTDFRFVFSDPENLGYTTVSKIDSNFRYYGHPRFDISGHRLLNVSSRNEIKKKFSRIFSKHNRQRDAFYSSRFRYYCHWPQRLRIV